MIQIHFNTLSIKNFFSIGAEIEIDFNAYKGMNYVLGINKDLNVKNGSGKSATYVDAILFALFNRTNKNVPKSKIPHRLVGKDCQVRLNFNVGDDNYTIENNVHYTFARLIKHNLDGTEEDLTKSSIKETYDHLEKEILKSTYLMFRNSLILSINDNKNIFKMSKWDKRQFTEQMMGLSHIGRMYNQAKDELNALDKELILKRQTANSLEKDVNEFKRKSESFNSDKKKHLLKLRDELEEIEMQINGMDTDDSDALNRKEHENQHKESLLTKSQKLGQVQESLLETILSMRADIKNFEATQKKYAKVLDVLCDCCTSKADQVLGIDSIKTNLADTLQKIKTLNEKREQLDVVISDINLQIKQSNEEIQKLDKYIAKIAMNRQELQFLSKEFDEKTNTLEIEAQKVSPFDDMIDKYQEELDNVLATIEEMDDNRKYLDFMVHMTSEDGVRKHLLMDYINMLNTRIRKYLQEMGCEYTAVFDGNLNCEFITTTGPCDYDNFSAGEKVRIDSACMFAFRDILFGQGTLQSNIFVCDEILDASLDEYAIQSVVKILKDIAKTQTVFVISHRECVSPEDFNNIIVVQKQNGYTTISQNEEGLEV